MIDDIMKFAMIELNLSFEDLIAMPENPEWRYDVYDGKECFTSAQFVTMALQ